MCNITAKTNHVSRVLPPDHRICRPTSHDQTDTRRIRSSNSSLFYSIPSALLTHYNYLTQHPGISKHTCTSVYVPPVPRPPSVRSEQPNQNRPLGYHFRIAGDAGNARFWSSIAKQGSCEVIVRQWGPNAMGEQG